ncbi:MAG TPA: hypothetical protein VG455_09345 [Acidimicrobiales bacterium]|nr:hypothetical protein [Acidimicrobiales bacterium]
MANLSKGTCPHGRTPSTCLVCQALDASELSDARRRARPERRAGWSPGVSWSLAKLAVVAVVVVLVVSWAAAFVWAALRILELMAVAVIAGWVCWRLGVRHGRRHPE